MRHIFFRTERKQQKETANDQKKKVVGETILWQVLERQRWENQHQQNIAWDENNEKILGLDTDCTKPSCRPATQLLQKDFAVRK